VKEITKDCDLLFFHGALQRVLILPRKVHHLRNFCFRDFKGKHANDSHTAAMDRQHQFNRLLVCDAEEAFQHQNDEFL